MNISEILESTFMTILGIKDEEKMYDFHKKGNISQSKEITLF